MKKAVIFLLALVAHASIFGQDWQLVGFPSAAMPVEQDLYIDPATGELYVAFIHGGTHRTTVQKWVNDTWQTMGDTDFGVGDDQDFVKLACYNGEAYAAINYTLGGSNYIRVYQLVSGVWTAMGNQGYQTNPDDNFSLEIGIDGTVYLMFYKVGTGFGISNNVNVIEVTSSSQLQVGGAVTMNTGYAYDLAIDPSGALRVSSDIYDGLQYKVYLSEYIGFWNSPYVLTSGSVGYKTKLVANAPATAENHFAAMDVYGNLTSNWSTGGVVTSTANIATSVTDFDMASGSSEDFVFYTTATNGQVMAVDGTGALSQVGVSAPSTTPVTSPKIETWNGRIVVSYLQFGMLIVKELNNTATFTMGAPFQLCEQVTTASSVPFISVNDNNYVHQNIVLNVTSNSPVVIPNLNIDLLGTFPDYSLELTSLVVLGDQIAQLQIELEENAVVVETQTLDLQVINKPDPLINLPVTEYCENAGLLNLAGIGTPAGGTWSGTGIVSGPKFNPSLAGPGLHTIAYSLTNSSGCTNSANVVVTVTDAPEISFAITSAACGDNDGEIDATVVGGTAPYAFYWSNGQQIEDIYGLESGVYTLFVTDQNGCEATETASTVSSGFSLDANITPVTCFGNNDGAIDLLLDSDDLLLIDNILWSNGSVTADVDNLPAGTYEVYVEATDGCVSTATFVVTSPTALGTTMYAADADCGLSTGATSCVTSGGVSPYDYQWYYSSTGAPVGSNQSFLTNVAQGAYHVVITDQNGCEYIGHSVVSEHGGPEIDVVSVTNSGCTTNGAVDISINSGQPVTSVLWSNGATTEDASGLTAGYYTVYVTDIAGCHGWAGAEVVSGTPQPVDICLVTVDTLTNNNMVVWEKPISADIESFNIYRETATAGEFLLVGNVPYSDESVFIDAVASPAIRSWRYKISTVNSCGGESELSAVHKTIHLTISIGLGSSVNLHWDEYAGFAFPAYDVYRHTNQNGWEHIQVMPTNLFSYSDTPPYTDGLQYMISVTPPNVCTSTTGKVQDHNSSRSNKSAAMIDGGTNGVEESETLGGLSVYPNPTSGEVSLRFENTESGAYTIQVFDARGVLMLEASSTDSNYVLNLAGFADGVYTLSVISGNKTMIRRIVKN